MRAGGLGFNMPNRSATVVQKKENVVEKNEPVVVEVPNDSFVKFRMRKIVCSRSFIVGCGLMTLLSVMSVCILTWYLFTI